MTQSIYGSPESKTVSKEELGDNPSSNEIRADIDQTRASVGEKIDQLQARLDPNRLKQQAQETVQEMISETATSMTDYVREHKNEMVNSLAEAARRNPLPTALVGLGIGWLILESMGGNKREATSPDYRYNPRYDPAYAPRDYAPRADDRWNDAGRYPPSPDSGRYGGSTGRSMVTQGRGPGLDEEIYASEFGDSAYDKRYSDERTSNGQSSSSNPLSKAADSVKEGVSDASQQVKEKVGDATQQVKDKVGDATQQVKEKVGDATQQVKESVSNVTDAVGGRVSDTVGQVRQQVGQMGDQTQRSLHRAGHQMDEWQQRARYEGQRRGRQVHHNLEDNPLIYGAVALAAGAALALLLPQTRTENRAFGEMRDQVMTKGQEILETAKSHAQSVVEEVRPELEQKTRQLVSDATEAGKEAIKSAAQELQPVVDKAISKGKEEARSAAQEIGVDPNELTTNGSNVISNTGPSANMPSSANPSQGKSLVINRDTLQGQWKQIKGEVKGQWGQLTDDDLMKMEGNYEKMVGGIQQRYGYTRERTEREINAFFDSHKG